MKSIVVTGCNGYVGSRFLRKLLDFKLNCRITSIVRTESFYKNQITEIIADINEVQVYEKDLLQADFVIWFAALRKHYTSSSILYDNNVAPVEKALRILRSSKVLKQFVYISTIAAIDNKIFSKHPIKDNAMPNPQSPYGISKLQAEKLVENSNCPYVILRLPFMYGSGFKPYTHLWFWKKIYKLPISFRNAEISLLHIDDLAKILVDIVSETIQFKNGEKILITDKKVYRIDEILNTMRANEGKTFLNLSTLIKRIHKVIPSKYLRYWSRLLFDRNAFTAVPSENETLNGYKFLTLKDGLAESYKEAHAPNKSIYASRADNTQHQQQ